VEPLETVSRVAAKTAPGRLHTFAQAHIVKALEEIGSQRAIGRMKLSRDLHLGEGEARTLVKHLKSEGLIEVSKSGVALSTAGRRLLSRLRAFMSEQVDVASTPLTVGHFNAAVRVRGVSDLVRYGLEQRDAALLAGARGATTLIFNKNTLVIAGTREDASKRDLSLLATLSKLDLKEGDIVIIGSADDRISAELGAKTAALELLRTRKS